MAAGSKPDVLHVLLSEEAAGLWLAHCLDCDFVAQGATMDEAKRNLRSALPTLASDARANGTEARLWQMRAPEEFWEKFGVATQTACKAVASASSANRARGRGAMTAPRRDQEKRVHA